MKYGCTRAVTKSTEQGEAFDSRAVNMGIKLAPCICLSDEQHQTGMEIRKKLLGLSGDRILKDSPIHPSNTNALSALGMFAGTPVQGDRAAIPSHTRRGPDRGHGSSSIKER